MYIFLPMKSREDILLYSLFTEGAFSLETKDGVKRYVHATMETPIQMLTHGHKCWANVGFYFAQRGFVTVLANHRLVPHVVYPGGADDMQLAREWIFENIAKQKYGRGSPEKVILLGHSSGGAHIAMNLYAAGDEFLDNSHHHSLLT